MSTATHNQVGHQNIGAYLRPLPTTLCDRQLIMNIKSKQRLIKTYIDAYNDFDVDIMISYII